MDAAEADKLRSLALAEAERYISSSGMFSTSSAISSGEGSSGGGTPGEPSDGGGGGGWQGGGRQGGGRQAKRQKDFLMDLDLWHERVGGVLARAARVAGGCA